MPRVMSFTDTFTRMYPEFIGEDYGIKTITFVVTEDCNLKCSYCYQGCKTKKVMTKEVAKEAIDLLLSNKNNYINSKGVILDFIGGEPFLEIELMDYIVEYFKYKTLELNHSWGKYYMLGISSNGTLYDNPKVKEFLLKNKNKVSLGITIDGNKELHDTCRLFHDGRPSYDIVIKNAREYMKFSNQSFGTTKLTVAPSNIDYLYKAVKNMHMENILCVHANCVYEEGWNEEHATKLYYQLKQVADYLLNEGYEDELYCSFFDEHIGIALDLLNNEDDNRNHCGGTGHMLAIGHDGTFYPCIRYMSYCLPSHREPISIGNLKDGIGIKEKDKSTIDKLQKITLCSQSTEECISCPIARGCGWCSGYNYDYTGDPNKRVTFICCMHKARVLANHYYYMKLLEVKNEDAGYHKTLNLPKEEALKIISEEEYNMLLNL